jgi:hypothetical protein
VGHFLSVFFRLARGVRQPEETGEVGARNWDSYSRLCLSRACFWFMKIPPAFGPRTVFSINSSSARAAV